MTPRPPLLTAPAGRRYRTTFSRHGALFDAVNSRVDGPMRRHIGFDRTIMRGPKLFGGYGFAGATHTDLFLHALTRDAT